MEFPISQINLGRIKVIFGQNSITTLPNELKTLGIRKPLFVTDPVLEKLGTAAEVTGLLQNAGLPYTVYSQVSPDPGSHLVDEASAVFRETGCDGVIGLGGGSVMDVAKCVAVMGNHPGRFLDYDYTNPEKREFTRDCLPLICIPTTSGTGAELSQYVAITNDETGVKAGAGSPRLLTHTAIVDPLLVRGLPRNATAACGCDTLAHCIEGFVSTKSLNAPNKIIDALALEGIELIYRYLPRAVENGEDMETREMVSWAATIGGVALQYGSGAAHGISNVVGGTHHVPHGNAIAMFLPHVLRFNAAQCAARYALVANRLGMRNADEVTEALAAMIERFQLPRLSAYVKEESELEALAKAAVLDKCTKYNGRAVTVDDALAILKKAY